MAAVSEREQLAVDVNSLLAGTEAEHYEGIGDFRYDRRGIGVYPDASYVALTTTSKEGEQTQCKIIQDWFGEGAFGYIEEYDLARNTRNFIRRDKSRSYVSSAVYPGEAHASEPLSRLDLACARQLIELFKERK